MASGESCTILVGSLRQDSVNRAAATYAAGHLRDHFTIHQPELAQIPLFNQDVEDVGYPEPVGALKRVVSESSLVLFFTPEYNYSTSGVLKNAIDWLSRPFGSGSLVGSVVGIASAGPGSRGGENAREHLLQTCSVLTDRLYRVTLGIPNVTKLEAGSLSEQHSQLLPHWLEDVIEFSRQPEAQAQKMTS